MTAAEISEPAKVAPRRWAVAGGLWLAAVAAICAVFYDTVEAMVQTWLNSATFNHCLLIPLICAYLAWERRAAFRLIPPQPVLWGAAAVLGAGLMWLMGRLVGALIVEQFALVFMAQALALTLWGPAAVRAMILPLGFMLFMVPFGDFLVQPLQSVTADFSVWLLRLIDIPIYREGVFISTPTGEFHVAEACSGVRFLVAMVPLGVLLAAMAYRSPWRKAAVMVVSVIIPIIANGIRAFGIIYIAYLTNNEYAVGVDHIIYGWVFFSIVTLLVIFVGMSFSDKPLDAPVADYSWFKPTAAVADGKRLATAAVMAVVALLPWSPLANRAAAVGEVPLGEVTMPVMTRSWREVQATPGWTPQYTGATQQMVATYRRDDGAEVVFYFAYYARQQEGAELVQFGNGVAPARWDWNGSRSRVVELSDREKTITESDIADLRNHRRVWHWYWVGGYVTANDYWAKLYHLWNRLRGGGDAGAVIALSTPEGFTRDDAPVVLQDFLRHAQASLPGFSTMNKQ